MKNLPMNSPNRPFVADRGYFSSKDLLASHEIGVTSTLPKPATLRAFAIAREPTFALCHFRRLEFFDEFGQVFHVAKQPFFDAAQMFAHGLGGAAGVVCGNGPDDDAVLFHKNGSPVRFGGLLADVVLVLTAPGFINYVHKTRQYGVS